MFRRMVWHATQGRRNPGWRARLREVRALCRLPAEALEPRLAERVAAHLAWARERLPFFRARAPRSLDLGAWPILTRADLQAKGAGLVDPGRNPAERIVDHSGGSTGEPVSFAHDAAYWAWTLAQEVAFHEWWGVAPWAPTAYLWGADRDLGAGWKERLEMRWLKRVQLNAFRVNPAGLDAFLARCRRWGVEVLQGYASALELLAAHVEESAPVGWRPRLVRSAAETLRPAVRARVAAAFGAPVRDVYGSRETAGIAVECAAGGLHVLAHGKVVEVVDEAGRPCPPGVPGRVLVTDLTNRAFGFVRYENGDVAAWAEPGPCPCGVTYPRLARVHGRTSDFLSTPDGRRVHGEFFTHLFYGQAGVTRFQVRQDSLTEVEVLTVGSIDARAMAPLLEAMRAQLGPAVRVAWRPVAAIDPGPSGKHRYTVSRVPFARAAPAEPTGGA